MKSNLDICSSAFSTSDDLQDSRVMTKGRLASEYPGFCRTESMLMSLLERMVAMVARCIVVDYVAWDGGNLREAIRATMFGAGNGKNVRNYGNRRWISSSAMTGKNNFPAEFPGGHHQIPSALNASQRRRLGNDRGLDRSQKVFSD